MSVCFALCMFLLRGEEEVVFVQEDRIEDRADDVTCQSGLLSTDALNGAPCHLALNVLGKAELTIVGEVAIYLQ